MEKLTTFDFTHAIQGVKHDQRWAIFKPELEALYHAGHYYTTISKYMKEYYHFDANVAAYKYRFDKWGWKKSLSARKKDEILDYAQQRASTGKRSAAISNDIPVAGKKLKRYVSSKAFTSADERILKQFWSRPLILPEIFLPFGMRLFALWNLPFGGALSGTTLSTFTNSPGAQPFDAPSDVVLETPPASHLSPGAQPLGTAPVDAASPFSSAVLRKASKDNAKLFLQARLIELLGKLDKDQMSATSRWLHQFWFFAFKTSQSWGTGNTLWSADLLRFDEYDRASSQQLIQPFNDSAWSDHMHSAPQLSPSVLCNWSIHLPQDELYEDVDNLNDEVNADTPPLPSLSETILEGLESSRFSTISSSQIPIDIPLITRVMANTPQILLEEALSFAIMAQNIDAIHNLRENSSREDFQNACTAIHAMHLATSYLSGGKMCCNVLSNILVYLSYNNIKSAYANEYGHTVLDNLMLSILRSHSSTPIGRVDASLPTGARYPGVEVDICGRWNADSACFRSLVATGATRIPSRWKHKFCHTSIQVICHCVSALYEHGGISCGELSALFQRLCPHCGLKLQLQPLHTLILVGYELANHACVGEDLFGIIVCYLCLLHWECDPLQQAHISVSALYDQEYDPSNCDHQPMTPLDLVQTLQGTKHAAWSPDLQLGWSLLVQVCLRAQNGQEQIVNLRKASEHRHATHFDELETFHLEHSYDNIYICEIHDETGSPFGARRALGHQWAAVQAELLNYRRLREQDPWMSSSFNISKIITSLETGVIPMSGYFDGVQLSPYGRCGWFEAWPFSTR